MPILRGGSYPSNVVKHQKELLELKGYHLIYDVPNTCKDWERPLPCTVTPGVCVDVFLHQGYQMDSQDLQFRFCLNHYGYGVGQNYVEIGDFPEYNHIVSTTVNGERGDARHTELVPKLGQYYWIRFHIEAPRLFNAYFCDTMIEERARTLSFDCSLLLTFYTHALAYNASEILSIHITKQWTQDAPTPLEGYIKQTTLSELHASNTLTAHGTYTGGTDRKLKFSITENSTQRKSQIFEVDVGSTDPTSIMFRILAYGVQAFAGDGHILAKTDFMAGSFQVFVNIEQNFNVDTLIIHDFIFDQGL